MKGALIILAFTVIAGVLLFIIQRFMLHRDKVILPESAAKDKFFDENGIIDADDNDSGFPDTDSAPDDQRPEGCCGQHITCEKDSLLVAMSKEIEYFEDEELDEYRGIAPNDYTDEQIEQFRDVLFTLRPEEIAAWARSIQLRGIELPTVVKDELIMLASEARGSLHS